MKAPQLMIPFNVTLEAALGCGQISLAVVSRSGRHSLPTKKRFSKLEKEWSR